MRAGQVVPQFGRSGAPASLSFGARQHLWYETVLAHHPDIGRGIPVVQWSHLRRDVCRDTIPGPDSGNVRSLRSSCPHRVGDSLGWALDLCRRGARRHHSSCASTVSAQNCIMNRDHRKPNQPAPVDAPVARLLAIVRPGRRATELGRSAKESCL